MTGVGSFTARTRKRTDVLRLAAAAVASWGCAEGLAADAGVEARDEADGDAAAPPVDVAPDEAGDDGDRGAPDVSDADADVPGETGTPPGRSRFPRLGMLIWGGASPAWLAEFDWVILPGNAERAVAAKALNPELIVSGTRDLNCCNSEGTDCPEAWRVRDTSGNPIVIYGGACYLGNTTDRCDRHEGRTYREYVAQYVRGLDWASLDGFNSDGFWGGVGWLAPIDVDVDGDNDGDDADLWREGRLAMLRELRAAVPPGKYLTLWAGGVEDFWGQGPEYLNGIGAEKFMVFSSWPGLLETYALYDRSAREPRVFYVNGSHEGDAGEGSSSKNNFRHMRFGLATTLLHDSGYYSYEDGEGGRWNEHFWVRYYDEFDVPLGEPLGPGGAIRDGVYCRFFTGGVAIVNGSTDDQTVAEADLRAAAASLGLDWSAVAGEGGLYYHFAGQQNPALNDGSPFSSAVLQSEEAEYDRRRGDGILLVRSPGQVVLAPVIVDTESFVTSPGAENAVLEGFAGTCGEPGSVIGFRTGYGWCSDVNPYYGYATSETGRGHRATFAASLVHEGTYRVFEYHPQVDGYDVPHRVHHAGGTDTILVDQRIGAERWNLLGSFRFSPAAPAQVVISDDAGGSEVAADAVRFEWAGPG